MFKNFIAMLHKYSRENYQPQVIAEDRIYGVELLDHGSIGLDTDDIKVMREILNNKRSTEEIAKYIGEKYTTDVCVILNEFAQKLLKEVVKTMPVYSQVYLSKNYKLKEVVYNFVCDTYSCDIDTKEFIRTLMEYDDPIAICTIHHQIKKEGKWEDENVYERPVDLEAYQQAITPMKDLIQTIQSRNEEDMITELTNTSPDSSRRYKIYFDPDTKLTDYIVKADWICNAYDSLILEEE